ncbi:Wadjet anti-phage system protein JetD domain-containing protein [Clostridium cellulovorans]|uniref:Wadjet protein JetD C-terminal domain-containing protein n=1 Tax=Clostridium cellulovorans (strain ATCC 35296 / DSM 3052 / OCM 3 / 743B) TaxID=573061 RepID=D9SQK9_CLOC7|nr:Wadjet anti-phage system protein JetD domain-containing protein [Clostridium cellulovorans]ADL52215.1 hypothetical protein Clocel_2503 [Clostridium cellulovorans 743B]
MRSYKEFLINSLLDSYERSSLYKGTSQKDHKIYFYFNKKNIKEYFDDTDLRYKKKIDADCEELGKRGFIEIVREETSEENVIEKVALNIEKLKECYKYVNRIEKSAIESDILNILVPYLEREDLLGEFSREISERIISKISVKKYFDLEKLQDVQDLLIALDYVVVQKKEILKKEFSAKVFGNSERYEEIENKVLRVLKDFGKEDYVRDYNICSYYSQIHMKGYIKIKTKKNFLDISEFLEGIALSSRDLSLIEEIKILDQQVTVVESLTAFHKCDETDGVFICLGGMQNFIRQELLTKILNNNRECSYYYYGNIDVESLRIYNYLRGKTNIEFQPTNMAKEVLIHNRSCCKELSVNDRKCLTEILEDEKYKEFYSLINFMLQENIKLEYERA